MGSTRPAGSTGHRTASRRRRSGARSRPAEGESRDPLAVFRGPAGRPARLLLAALLVIAAAAWSATIATAAGMDPGMTAGMIAAGDAAGIGFFLLAWTVMMVAMMIPAAIPMAQAYVHLGIEQDPAEGSKWVAPQAILFLGSYILVWTAFGAGIVALYVLLHGRVAELGMSGTLGPRLAGAVILGAGIYQATPLKQVCLTACRSPMAFLMERWIPGVRGALDLGLRHAAYCVGCCWLLFLVLFAVGVMSLPWMALLAAIIFVEKTLPQGRTAASAVGVAFAVIGVLFIALPGTAAPLLGMAG